jgi:hypothetical protein
MTVDESSPLLLHNDAVSKPDNGGGDACEEKPKSFDTLRVLIALVGG